MNARHILFGLGLALCLAFQASAQDVPCNCGSSGSALASAPAPSGSLWNAGLSTSSPGVPGGFETISSGSPLLNRFSSVGIDGSWTSVNPAVTLSGWGGDTSPQPFRQQPTGVDPSWISTAGVPLGTSDPYLVPTSFSAVSPSAATPPYSYYLAMPAPARNYVPYPTSDFPFYGQPYGSPNDRWSWSAMSGDDGLSRYYWPPVR